MNMNKVMGGLTLLLLLCSEMVVAAGSLSDFVYDPDNLSDFVYEDYLTFKDGMKALNSGDVETALTVWTSLAKKGNIKAQEQLGFHYYLGHKSFPQNYKNALKWFTKAAKQGDSDSQMLLGLMYEKAQGVLIDYRLAYMWMNLGGYNGYGSSHHMDRLIKKMVPADISRAQKMSKRCLKSNYTDCKDSFFDKFYSIFE
jgi:TPR repeat protein